eukprot:1408864-Alexandrium_andersonii.AAC.1
MGERSAYAMCTFGCHASIVAVKRACHTDEGKGVPCMSGAPSSVMHAFICIWQKHAMSVAQAWQHTHAL